MRLEPCPDEIEQARVDSLLSAVLKGTHFEGYAERSEPPLSLVHTASGGLSSSVLNGRALTNRGR